MPTIRQRIAKDAVVHTDESPAWNPLHAPFAKRRINHQHGYSIDDACTNGAQAYLSRLRRAEIGRHHHIAGPYLVRCAQEAAWRRSLRRVSSGEQADGVIGLAMRSSPWSISAATAWSGPTSGYANISLSVSIFPASSSMPNPGSEGA